MEERFDLNVKGQACLCFTEDHQSFQGYMITPEKQQLTLSGMVDESHVIPNACCYDDKPLCYNVDVVDCDSTETKQFTKIIRHGGDNCSLLSENLNFHTDQLLTGPHAEECSAKFFGSITNCYVCVGDITISTL